MSQPLDWLEGQCEPLDWVGWPEGQCEPLDWVGGCQPLDWLGVAGGEEPPPELQL